MVARPLRAIWGLLCQVPLGHGDDDVEQQRWFKVGIYDVLVRQYVGRVLAPSVDRYFVDFYEHQDRHVTRSVLVRDAGRCEGMPPGYPGLEVLLLILVEQFE